MLLKKNILLLYLFMLLFFAGLASVCVAQSGSAMRLKTVVIDPGHGGHDPGTVSAGAKYQEKNIVLSVALKLGNMIKQEYPNIKVIYTRSTDKFVPLAERSNIANRNKADLFISIHVNSAPKAPGANGTETYVMGTHKSESNFELCKTENSVITLEDDYTANYEGFNPDSPESYIIFSLLQNTHLEQSLKLAEIIQKNYRQGPIYGNRGVKQGGLIVLWRSTMPAVLTEIGFMSNSKDRATMVTQSGQTSIAKRLFNSFCEYKRHYEDGAGSNIPTKIQGTAGSNRSDNATSATGSNRSGNATTADNLHGSTTGNDYYSIQILSVAKPLKANAPDLKGRKDYKYLKSDNRYKYFIGSYKTQAQAAKALPKIRKSFKGAFVIHIRDNKIVKK